MMREWKIACVVAGCVLGLFALVASAYVVFNPEVAAAFFGPVANR
jgi:hypothetical protein